MAHKSIPKRGDNKFANKSIETIGDNKEDDTDDSHQYYQQVIKNKKVI